MEKISQIIAEETQGKSYRTSKFELDAEIFDTAEKNGLTFDALEKKINFFAQEGNFSMTFTDLTEEILNFIMSFK